jgi:hypothetical protein
MPHALPTETFSVGSFCQTARELLESPEPDDTAAFVRFTLTGIYNDHQTVIDPILNRVRSTETSSLQLRRDYDSILGISENICVRSNDVTIYPIPKHDDSLKKNVHLEFDFRNIRVRIWNHRLPYLLDMLFIGSADSANPSYTKYMHCEMEATQLYSYSIRRLV